MLFRATFLAGIGPGCVPVTLMAVGGALLQRGTWAKTMVAIPLFT